MKFASSYFLVLALLVMSFYADAKGHQGEESKFKKLNLSAEQKKQLKTLRQENQSKGKEIFKQVRQARLKLDKALAGDASESELNSIHEEIKNLNDQKEDLHFQKTMKTRQILTKEQREKFFEMKSKKRKQRHAKWKGKKKGKRKTN